MNYKIVTIALMALIVIGSLITYNYVRNIKSTIRQEIQNNYKNEFEMFEFLSVTDDDLIEEWTGKDTLKIHPDTTGELITVDEGKKKLENFRRRNTNPNGDAIISPFAFAFGLNKMKEFIYQIDSLNDAMSPCTLLDCVQGVRIYLIETTKRNKTYLDLVMVPARGNGKDFYQVADTTGFLPSTPLFNTSSPCPNMCN